MHKTRRPLSIASAITRVIGLMTAEGAGHAVGKSAALMYKWSNPDEDTLPNIEQALQLDIAFFRAGFGVGPILQSYSEIYRKNTGALPPLPDSNLKDCALMIQHAVGMFSNITLKALSPHSAAGEIMTSAEYKDICQQLDCIKTQINVAERALNCLRQPSAGQG